ncbi:hypothetical protein [Blastococcus saxobsidens]|uniref:hypothetical protein n=1 Tax=Blastococcus saxobsidens TaxID=138336 RepID=UPI0005A0D065|nr:hypothetical protein [Blastococcus saxobsidens]
MGDDLQRGAVGSGVVEQATDRLQAEGGRQEDHDTEQEVATRATAEPGPQPAEGDEDDGRRNEGRDHPQVAGDAWRRRRETDLVEVLVQGGEVVEGHREQ